MVDVLNVEVARCNIKKGSVTKLKKPPEFINRDSVSPDRPSNGALPEESMTTRQQTAEIKFTSRKGLLKPRREISFR